jgi:hypothetical protein
MVGERRSRPTDSMQPCHPASSRVDALALRGHTTVASANLETKPKAFFSGFHGFGVWMHGNGEYQYVSEFLVQTQRQARR